VASSGADSTDASWWGGRQPNVHSLYQIIAEQRTVHRPHWWQAQALVVLHRLARYRSHDAVFGQLLGTYTVIPAFILTTVFIFLHCLNRTFEDL